MTESGNTLNSKDQFVKQLSKITTIKKVKEREDCHAILGFCPVISRVGTDIEAALKEFSKGINTVMVGRCSGKGGARTCIWSFVVGD